MAEYDRPIIIKKVKKAAHAHHGGAWKIAYADFVTAMMAFFLLLWLISMTTPEQKKGLADYFSPPNVIATPSGAGGVLGGHGDGNQRRLEQRRGTRRAIATPTIRRVPAQGTTGICGSTAGQVRPKPRGQDGAGPRLRRRRSDHPAILAGQSGTDHRSPTIW